MGSPNDPRITRVGNIIRKLRIDELPQILNVLKGEMSFVGPRPERPYFVDQLTRARPVLQRPAQHQAGHHRLGAGALRLRRLRRGCGAESCSTTCTM
jgi:hypothetical protein